MTSANCKDSAKGQTKENEHSDMTKARHIAAQGS